MNAYRELDSMLHVLARAKERFDSSLETACREAGQMSVESVSAGRSVKITMDAKFSVKEIRFHPHAYERHTSDTLRGEILSAYRRAVMELQYRQKQKILSTITSREQEPT